MKFFKDGYNKRGIIYIGFGLFGLVYEFIFRQPARPVVLLLWAGIVCIGIIVIFTLKDPKD